MHMSIVRTQKDTTGFPVNTCAPDLSFPLVDSSTPPLNHTPVPRMYVSGTVYNGRYSLV